MDTFIAVVKALGILLYAPGILALIPQVPEWVAKIFPTYYMVDPVIQISQKGAGLSELAGELAILLAFVATLLLALVFVAERQKEKIALAG
jgi:ABC-2 type transport system permease protein